MTLLSGPNLIFDFEIRAGLPVEQWFVAALKSLRKESQCIGLDDRLRSPRIDRPGFRESSDRRINSAIRKIHVTGPANLEPISAKAAKGLIHVFAVPKIHFRASAQVSIRGIQISICGQH